jgi:hypothetical protein
MSGLMTQARRRPALEAQVAAIPPALMVVVQNVMSTAWRVLLEDVRQGDFSISDATEDQITERLHTILRELDAAGDSAVLGLTELQTPVREEKISNYDGTHLDKQPDLTFRPMRGRIPCRDTGPVAIFIECKPIDARHPLPSTYCRDGLIRFVNGDYAWGVDRAMMVGYVRNVCALPGGLSTAISAPILSAQMELIGRLEELPNTTSGDAVCQTTHNRPFQLPGTTNPVGQIVVNHLWLHPAEPCELTRCRAASE